MLRFIRQLFGEKEQERVEVQDIEQWFRQKSSGVHSDFEAYVAGHSLKIQKRIEAIVKALEGLRTANLRNPDVPGKAVNYMEGNRSAYIKRVDDFLNTLDLSQIKQTRTFILNFKDGIKRLSTSSERPYTIIQEFLAEESGEVADAIRDLNTCVEVLDKEHKKRNIGMLRGIEHSIRQLLDHIELKSTQEKALAETEEKLKKTEEDHRTAEQYLEQIQASKDFLKYRELKTRADDTRQRLHSARLRISHPFTVIEASLKKFERIAYEDESAVKQFLDDPVIALSQHKDVLPLIVSKLRDNILSNAIELKDTKKKRILTELDTMTPEYFDGTLAEIAMLESKLNEQEQEIQSLDMDSKVQGAKQRTEQMAQQLGDLRSKTIDLKERMEHISIAQLKRGIERKVKDVLGDVVLIA